MAKVKVVKSFPEVKVQIVKLESHADLLVFLTESETAAKGKDEIWYLGESFPDVKISFVANFPDLKVFYVKNKSKAGWRNKKHKLQGQIG